MQFYQIFRTFYSTESGGDDNTNYNTVTTFAPPVVGNDSRWNDDTAKKNTLYNIFGKMMIEMYSEKDTIL